MDKLTYESAISRLEEIVKQLESGSCTLDSTVKLYDEGLKLAVFCNESLGKAKQKISSIEDYLKETEINEE